MLDLNELKSLKVETIFELLKPLIDDTYVQYKSLLKSQEKYYEVVLNEISKSKELYNGSISYSNYLEDRIQYSILKLIINQYLSKEKGEKLYYSGENSVSLINIYLKDVFSQPILGKEEREMLLVKSCNGDLSARKKLIESNLRIVVNTAIQYIGIGMDFLDIVQEGNIALQKAFDSYDMSKSKSFWSYLYITINGHIKSKLRTLDKQVKLFSSLDESYDTELVDDTFEEYIENSQLNESLIEFIDKCELTNMEYNVLRLVFGLDGSESMTLNQIKEVYGVTNQCVSLYYRKALKKLKGRAKRLQENSEEVLKQDYIKSHKKELNILRTFISNCTVADVNKVLPRLTMFELQVIRLYSSGVADELVSSYKPVELYTFLSKEIVPKVVNILEKMRLSEETSNAYIKKKNIDSLSSSVGDVQTHDK